MSLNTSQMSAVEVDVAVSNAFRLISPDFEFTTTIGPGRVNLVGGFGLGGFGARIVKTLEGWIMQTNIPGDHLYRLDDLESWDAIPQMALDCRAKPVVE